MKLEVIIVLWAILAISIIYWDTQRWDKVNPKFAISTCHNSEIKMIKERPMCTECKLYCEIKK